jgi:hypothetical protein
MAEPLGDLVSLRWERIQVIIRIRPATPDAIDPPAVRLQRTDDPAGADEASHMVATRAGPGRQAARFNVMQGPGGARTGAVGAVGGFRATVAARP